MQDEVNRQIESQATYEPPVVDSVEDGHYEGTTQLQLVFEQFVSLNAEEMPSPAHKLMKSAVLFVILKNPNATGKEIQSELNVLSIDKEAVESVRIEKKTLGMYRLRNLPKDDDGHMKDQYDGLLEQLKQRWNVIDDKKLVSFEEFKRHVNMWRKAATHLVIYKFKDPLTATCHQILVYFNQELGAGQIKTRTKFEELIQKATEQHSFVLKNMNHNHDPNLSEKTDPPPTDSSRHSPPSPDSSEKAAPDRVESTQIQKTSTNGKGKVSKRNSPNDSPNDHRGKKTSTNGKCKVSKKNSTNNSDKTSSNNRRNSGKKSTKNNGSNKISQLSQLSLSTSNRSDLKLPDVPVVDEVCTNQGEFTGMQHREFVRTALINGRLLLASSTEDTIEYATTPDKMFIPLSLSTNKIMIPGSITRRIDTPFGQNVERTSNIVDSYDWCQSILIQRKYNNDPISQAMFRRFADVCHDNLFKKGTGGILYPRGITGSAAEILKEHLDQVHPISLHIIQGGNKKPEIECHGSSDRVTYTTGSMYGLQTCRVNQALQDCYHSQRVVAVYVNVTTWESEWEIMKTKAADDECLFLGYFYVLGFGTKGLDNINPNQLFDEDYLLKNTLNVCHMNEGGVMFSLGLVFKDHKELLKIYEDFYIQQEGGEYNMKDYKIRIIPEWCDERISVKNEFMLTGSHHNVVKLTLDHNNGFVKPKQGGDSMGPLEALEEMVLFQAGCDFVKEVTPFHELNFDPNADYWPNSKRTLDTREEEPSPPEWDSSDSEPPPRKDESIRRPGETEEEYQRRNRKRMFAMMDRGE